MPHLTDPATPQSTVSDETSTAELDELIGTVLAGNYRIEALLGVGGMGAVYRATHVLMRKTVALKVLHAEMAAIPEALARFEREAVAAGRVAHPNVARALDFGRLPNGAFYMVMEYIPGELLRNALGAGAMPLERVVRIGVQIAAALHAAHAAGIVHRDLKPENVILTSRASEPDQVKLLDLGIAKVPIEQTSGTALTRAGAVLGTPQYMAPEQGLGGSVDHRADLYALGVVLYEMAAGKPPFSDDDGAVAAIARHLTEVPPPLPASVPEALASLILKLLEKQASERPQSAAEVVEHLQALLVLGEAPKPAPAISLASTTLDPETARMSERRGWWSRRRIVAIAAAALLLALLVIGAAKPDDASSEPDAPLASAAAAASTAPLTRAVAPAVEPAAATSRASAPPERQPARRADEAPAPKSKRKSRKKKEESRRTGPGGIYVPPPEDWF